MSLRVHPNQIRINHFNSAAIQAWEDLGGTVNVARHTITVTTDSLSPFVLSVPEPPTAALGLFGAAACGVIVLRPSLARRREAAIESSETSCCTTLYNFSVRSNPVSIESPETTKEASEQKRQTAPRTPAGHLTAEQSSPPPAVRNRHRPQVTLDDSKALAAYANFCRVTGTPEELIIDCGLNPQPFGMPTEPIAISQRLIVNFYTAKRLLAALQMTLQRTRGLLVFWKPTCRSACCQAHCDSNPDASNCTTETCRFALADPSMVAPWCWPLMVIARRFSCASRALP